MILYDVHVDGRWVSSHYSVKDAESERAALADELAFPHIAQIIEHEEDWTPPPTTCDECGLTLARYHGPGDASGWTCVACDDQGSR